MLFNDIKTKFDDINSLSGNMRNTDFEEMLTHNLENRKMKHWVFCQYLFEDVVSQSE